MCLYPPAISEGAGSLLPEETRPAILWTMEVDASGEGTDVAVRPCARPQSREARLRRRPALARQTAPRRSRCSCCARSACLRQKREERLGAINLTIPEQEIEKDATGYVLRFRGLLPVEGWNAQISLLTGQAAAQLMLGARLGILRTLPEADPKAVDRLRRTAKALGIDWGEELSYAGVIRTLDPEVPAHAAFLVESTVLLRGSGYEAFDGEAPSHPVHAGIGAPYAHTTAPLRRLVDRYVGEVCVALCADAEVPDWARSALPELPETMERSDRHAQQYEAGIVSAVEAAVLAESVGQEFDAVVVEVDEKDGGGVVQLVEPAVTARCEGDVPLGERVRVRLTLADVAKRQVRFELV